MIPKMAPPYPYLRYRSKLNSAAECEVEAVWDDQLAEPEWNIQGQLQLGIWPLKKKADFSSKIKFQEGPGGLLVERIFEKAVPPFGEFSWERRELGEELDRLLHPSSLFLIYQYNPEQLLELDKKPDLFLLERKGAKKADVRVVGQREDRILTMTELAAERKYGLQTHWCLDRGIPVRIEFQVPILGSCSLDLEEAKSSASV